MTDIMEIAPMNRNMKPRMPNMRALHLTSDLCEAKIMGKDF